MTFFKNPTQIILANLSNRLSIGVLVIFCITSILSSNANAEQINDLKYSFDADKGFNLYFDDYAKLKIGTDIECGPVRDGSLYASFGLEGQILHCSKVVFNFDGRVESDNGNEWLFKLDVAPLYNSIESRNAETIIYEKDSQGHDINGNNFYNDWYKNLGSRVYYLGKVPLIETYLGYKIGDHIFKFGRMKGPVGIDDSEVFWGDDGKFAPMGHWLTRDLLSGASYSTKYSMVEGEIGIYSGGNPAKGYSNYLNKIESPNLKSNNTPTAAAKLKLHYGDLLPEDFGGYIYGSYLFSTTGSTWVDELKDGKRNSSTGAYGVVFDKFFDNNFINKLRIFGQYNHYDSGLRMKSAQNDRSKKFRDIIQSGFFVGSEINMLDDKLSIGAAYEKFDRFDFNLHQKFNYSESNPYKNAKQFSRIYSIKYHFNPAVSVSGSYHILKNPALFASDILDTRKTDKVKISLNVNF